MSIVQWGDTCLGEGKFSDVYLGEFQLDEKRCVKCAVKVFKKGADETVMTRELRIYEVLDNDPHPAFLQMLHHELTNREKPKHIALSVFSSQNLYTALIKSPKVPSITTIDKVVFNLLEGLAFLANKGIVHGDLKPENVLYDEEDDTVKLIDFGSSEPIIKGQRCTWDQCTPQYRAPEACVSIPFDETVDVWALACITAELFSKKLLFSVKKRESDDLTRKSYLEQNRDVIGYDAPESWRKNKAYPEPIPGLQKREWGVWCRSEYSAIGGKVRMGDKVQYYALCTFIGRALIWERPSAKTCLEFFQKKI